MLCNSFLYTNNIQKYYSVSRCVISIIIVIAPTCCKNIVDISFLRRNKGYVGYVWLLKNLTFFFFFFLLLGFAVTISIT